MRPKTIKIFLPEGSATGIKEAEVTNRLILAMSIPRSGLSNAATRELSSYTGIYFLFGESEDESEPIVYIGQAESCLARIKNHNRTKDFWNRCVLIVSKTNSYTKTDISFLEYHAIKKAAEIKRYISDNQAIPNKPSISESAESDLLDDFDTIKILLSTLGFPVFEETREKTQRRANTYYCSGKMAQASGEYIEDGFVVLKDSTANLKETNTAGSWVIGMREKLLKAGKLIIDDDKYRFTADHVFGSPSSAAASVLGRQANGWKEWKNSDGKTLDEIERQ